MRREARSITTSDCRSRAIPQASQTTSGAIGRPQMASVSRKLRASWRERHRVARRTSRANVGQLARPAVADARVEGQLLQHERAAARLARQLQLVLVGERWSRRAAGLRRAPVPRRPSSARVKVPTTRARRARSSRAWRNGLAAISSLRNAQQREHRRRARRAEQLLEQDRCCRHRPTADRRSRRRATVGSRAGGAAPPTPRRRDAGREADRRPRIPGCGRHAATASTCEQHREHPRQRGHVGRQQASMCLAWQRPEIAAQVVDDAIECLVRDRLVLVAAAGEHDDVARAPPQLAESVGPARSCRCPRGRRRRRPSRRRARPRRARRAAPAADAGVRQTACPVLVAASGWRSRGRVSPLSASEQPAAPFRRCSGLATQQSHADGAEIRRHPTLARWRPGGVGSVAALRSRTSVTGRRTGTVPVSAS